MVANNLRIKNFTTSLRGRRLVDSRARNFWLFELLQFRSSRSLYFRNTPFSLFWGFASRGFTTLFFSKVLQIVIVQHWYIFFTIASTVSLVVLKWTQQRQCCDFLNFRLLSLILKKKKKRNRTSSFKWSLWIQSWKKYFLHTMSYDDL